MSALAVLSPADLIRARAHFQNRRRVLYEEQLQACLDAYRGTVYTKAGERVRYSLRPAAAPTPPLLASTYQAGPGDAAPDRLRDASNLSADMVAAAARYNAAQAAAYTAPRTQAVVETGGQAPDITAFLELLNVAVADLEQSVNQAQWGDVEEESNTFAETLKGSATGVPYSAAVELLNRFNNMLDTARQNPAARAGAVAGNYRDALGALFAARAVLATFATNQMRATENVPGSAFMPGPAPEVLTAPPPVGPEPDLLGLLEDQQPPRRPGDLAVEDLGGPGGGGPDVGGPPGGGDGPGGGGPPPLFASAVGRPLGQSGVSGLSRSTVSTLGSTRGTARGADGAKVQTSGAFGLNSQTSTGPYRQFATAGRTKGRTKVESLLPTPASTPGSVVAGAVAAGTLNATTSTVRGVRRAAVAAVEPREAALPDVAEASRVVIDMAGVTASTASGFGTFVANTASGVAPGTGVSESSRYYVAGLANTGVASSGVDTASSLNPARLGHTASGGVVHEQGLLESTATAVKESRVHTNTDINAAGVTQSAVASLAGNTAQRSRVNPLTTSTKFAGAASAAKQLVGAFEAAQLNNVPRGVDAALSNIRGSGSGHDPSGVIAVGGIMSRLQQGGLGFLYEQEEAVEALDTAAVAPGTNAAAVAASSQTNVLSPRIQRPPPPEQPSRDTNLERRFVAAPTSALVARSNVANPYGAGYGLPDGSLSRSRGAQDVLLGRADMVEQEYYIPYSADMDEQEYQRRRQAIHQRNEEDEEEPLEVREREYERALHKAVSDGLVPDLDAFERVEMNLHRQFQVRPGFRRGAEMAFHVYLQEVQRLQQQQLQRSAMQQGSPVGAEDARPALTPPAPSSSARKKREREREQQQQQPPPPREATPPQQPQPPPPREATPPQQQPSSDAERFTPRKLEKARAGHYLLPGEFHAEFKAAHPEAKKIGTKISKEKLPVWLMSRGVPEAVAKNTFFGKGADEKDERGGGMDVEDEGGSGGEDEGTERVSPEKKRRFDQIYGKLA